LKALLKHVEKMKMSQFTGRSTSYKFCLQIKRKQTSLISWSVNMKVIPLPWRPAVL